MRVEERADALGRQELLVAVRAGEAVYGPVRRVGWTERDGQRRRDVTDDVRAVPERQLVARGQRAAL